MPADHVDAPLNHTADTLVADGSEPLKSLDAAAAGTMRVGAYAIRFADRTEKDLTGEYFTANTDFGPTLGNGAATMFNHGMIPAKGLQSVFGPVCDQTYPPVKVTRDDTGLFVETTLDLSDKYQAAIGQLVSKGKLKWSSGSSAHVKRATNDGEIKRWHPLEYSFTPTPAEPRNGAIRPLKSVDVSDADAADIAAAFAVDNPAPADTQRSASPSHPTVKVMPAELTAEQKTAVTDATKLRLDEINQITALGSHFKCVDVAATFISEGKSVDEFRTHILEEVKKAPQVITTPVLGLNRREVKSYSLLKAVRESASEKGLTGLEKEASEATAKITKQPYKGFLLPQDVAEVSLAESHGLSANAIKTLNQTIFNQGGALVGTNILTGSMIELLRNKPLMAQMGAMTMTGLVGDVAIPRIQGGATAYWLSETAPVPESDQIFGQLGLKPKRLVADTAWTKELANQTDLSVEALVRNDLTTVLALAKDLAAINGQGGAQPLGILNTTGTSPVTFAGTASRQKAIAFQKAVAVANASRGSLAYLSTPGVSASWLGTPEAANYPKFLWDGNIDQGTVVGRPAYSTNQVPNDLVIYGNFNDLILADWAGIDVVVDPYSLKKQGMIEITITLWCDVGVRHAVSFAVSTDSGAQ